MDMFDGDLSKYWFELTRWWSGLDIYPPQQFTKLEVCCWVGDIFDMEVRKLPYNRAQDPEGIPHICFQEWKLASIDERREYQVRCQHTDKYKVIVEPKETNNTMQPNYYITYDADGNINLNTLATTTVTGNVPVQTSWSYYTSIGDSQMATINPTTPTSNDVATARRYLNDRLYDEQNKKARALRDTFNLDEPDAPSTIKDLKDRLATGQYTINKRAVLSYDDENPFTEDTVIDDDWTNVWNFISWRKPGEKPDQDGYEAALEVLRKDYTAAKDIITVKDPADDGLNALNSFKLRTYH